jgi:hypothetical protein
MKLDVFGVNIFHSMRGIRLWLFFILVLFFFIFFLVLLILFKKILNTILTKLPIECESYTE